MSLERAYTNCKSCYEEASRTIHNPVLEYVVNTRENLNLSEHSRPIQDRVMEALEEERRTSLQLVQIGALELHESNFEAANEALETCRTCDRSKAKLAERVEAYISDNRI